MNTNGVPDVGVGLLAWPADANFNTVFDTFTQQSGIFPTSMLVYAGDFESINTIVGNLQGNVTLWAANPRLNGQAFTDTNGTYWPARAKPVIPCIGITFWTTSEDMTFASIVAGTNDAQIEEIATMWFNAGFKEIEVRIGYEDDYPTTPAGEDSSTLSQFGGSGAVAA